MIDDFTRRGFLSGSTAALAGTAALADASLAAGADDVVRLGLVGCGGMMNGHARGLVTRGSAAHVAWICDVDTRQLSRIAGTLNGFQKQAPRRTGRYEDVLADPAVDAVVIATPHHWHAHVALAAIQAGKDVYIEKPMSHVLAEGRLILDAARKHKRVVQHGSQMRSSAVTAAAGKLLAEGIIGEVRISKAWNVQRRGTRRVVPDTSPPGGVDYDRWLGPAPVRGFNVDRFHGNWRVYRNYGNGDIGDDGIHDIDMARWGLGVTTHPIRVTAHGSDSVYRGDNKGGREFPDNMNVSYEYADGRVLIYEDRLFTPYGMHGYDSGDAFYGTEGFMIFSRRGAFQVFLGPKAKPGPTEPKETRTQRGYNEHMEEFLQAVRTRNFNTSSNAEIAHLSCSLVHLGEIAFRTRGRLDFDPKTEKFIDAPDANALLTKNYRKGYELPIG